MHENEFYVAIQFILENAFRSGRNLAWIERTTQGALEEFLEELEPVTKEDQ